MLFSCYFSKLKAWNKDLLRLLKPFLQETYSPTVQEGAGFSDIMKLIWNACKTIARKLDSSSLFSWKNLSSKFLVLAWIMESKMCLLNLQTELGKGSKALKSWIRIKTNSGDWPNGLNKIQCSSGRRNVEVTFSKKVYCMKMKRGGWGHVLRKDVVGSTSHLNPHTDGLIPVLQP